MPGPPRRRCQSSVGRYPDPAFLFALARMNNDSPRQSLLEQLDIPPRLNAVLESLMGIERALVRAGCSFPVGNSRLAVARSEA